MHNNILNDDEIQAETTMDAKYSVEGGKALMLQG